MQRKSTPSGWRTVTGCSFGEWSRSSNLTIRGTDPSGDETLSRRRAKSDRHLRTFVSRLARASLFGNSCEHDFYIIETGATANVSKTEVTITHSSRSQSLLHRRERYRQNSSPQRG